MVQAGIITLNHYQCGPDTGQQIRLLINFTDAKLFLGGGGGAQHAEVSSWNDL